MPATWLKIQHQFHTNWCWAAVAVSIERHFAADSEWTQCKLASVVAQRRKLPVTNCCSGGHKRIAEECNDAWYLDRALRIVRRLAGRLIPHPLSFREVRRHILEGRPVCARILWWGIEPNAHFVVISGCYVGNDGSRWLDIEDSFWGSSTWRYEVFRSNYKYARGRWVASYLTKPDKN